MVLRAVPVLVLLLLAASLCEGSSDPRTFRARKYTKVQSSGYGQAKPTRPKATGIKIKEGLACATKSNAGKFVEQPRSFTFPGMFMAVSDPNDEPLAGVGCSKKGHLLDTSAVQSLLTEGNVIQFKCYDLAQNSRISLASLSRTGPHVVRGEEEPVRGIHIDSLIKGCAWTGSNVLELLDGVARREHVPFIDLEDQSTASCQGPVAEFLYPMRVAYPLLKGDREMRSWYESKGYQWQGYNLDEHMSSVAAAMGQPIMPLPEAEERLGMATLSDALAVFMLPHVLYKKIFPDDTNLGMMRMSKSMPISWPEETFEGWCKVINCNIESVLGSDMAFPAYETVSLFSTLQSLLQDVSRDPDTCAQFSLMLEGVRAGSLSTVLEAGIEALEERRGDLEKEAAEAAAKDAATTADEIGLSSDDDGTAERARPVSGFRSRLLGDIERGAGISGSDPEETPKPSKFKSRLMGDIERSSTMEPTPSIARSRLTEDLRRAKELGSERGPSETANTVNDITDSDGAAEFLEEGTGIVNVCHSSSCLASRKAVYAMVFLHLLQSSHVDEDGIDLEAMNKEVETTSYYIQLNEERFRIKWSQERRQLLHAFLAMTNRYARLGTFRKVFGKTA